jgi:hypothetical protein
MLVANVGDDEAARSDAASNVREDTTMIRSLSTAMLVV